ncbi:MAG: kelch repeat-containing protein [Flavisolibacter sp.]
MNYVTISALLFLLFSTAELSAQKSKVTSIQWDIAGVLPSVNGKALGYAGPVVGISNDVLVVGGGSNFPDSMPWLGGKKRYYDHINVFKKNRQDSLIVFKSFKLPFPLAYSANVSTDKGIVVAGGENENGVRNTVLLINWDGGTQALTINNLPTLPLAVTNASIVVYSARICLAGGETANGGVSDQFFSLDLNDINSGWKTLPSLPKPISHAVMAVQSNGENECIYLVGGRKKNTNSPSNLYASNLQFNLNTRQWTEMKPLPHNLSAGTGVAVGRNLVLLFGGDNGATFHKTEELIFAINNEKDEAKRAQLTAEKIRVQSMHPGFCREALLYDTKKDRWQTVGCIPYEAPVTTTAVKWNDEIVIPGGEIRAGVRTPQILSAKNIFK